MRSTRTPARSMASVRLQCAVSMTRSWPRGVGVKVSDSSVWPCRASSAAFTSRAACARAAPRGVRWNSRSSACSASGPCCRRTRCVCSTSSSIVSRKPARCGGTVPCCTAALSWAYRSRVSGSFKVRAKASTSSARTSRSAALSSNSAPGPTSVAGFAKDHLQLVLEATRLDGAVHPALFGRIGFPPPAARPAVLPRRNRARAGGAANALVPPIIERVIWHVVLPHVLPDLLFRPVGQGIDFDDAAVVVIQLDLADVGAGGPLVAPQPGDPGIQAAQHADERAHLADVAARQPQRHRAVEQVRAVAPHHRFHFPAVGEVHLNLDPVALPDTVDEVVALLRQAAGVHGEHAYLRIDPPGHVQDGHAVDLEAGADGNSLRRKGLQRPANDLLGLLIVVFDAQLADLPVVQADAFVRQLFRYHWVPPSYLTDAGT